MKKVLIHIGAHAAGVERLQNRLFVKAPAQFADPVHLENSRFMKLFENRLVKPRGAHLAELFQQALYRPDMETYRVSCARLMGKPFQKACFYPGLKRYSQLVNALRKEGITVKTLVLTRARADFLVSCYKRGVSGTQTSSFHDFANHSVTPAYSWQQFAEQLSDASVTYLPWEAAETQPAELAQHINKFFETKLLIAEDLKEHSSQSYEKSRKATVKHLEQIEDVGLRTRLLSSAEHYYNQQCASGQLSEERLEIYRSHFREGDVTFAKAHFPSAFRRIYVQQKAISEQFWLPFVGGTP